jgi:hypothetical protein
MDYLKVIKEGDRFRIEYDDNDCCWFVLTRAELLDLAVKIEDALEDKDVKE